MEIENLLKFGKLNIFQTTRVITIVRCILYSKKICWYQHCLLQCFYIETNLFKIINNDKYTNLMLKITRL